MSDSLPSARILFASDALEIGYLPGSSGQLVVVFSSIGESHEIARGLPARNEFIGSVSASGRRHVLFVKDNMRSWFTHQGVRDLWQAVALSSIRLIRPSHVTTLGLSMGGYAAIRFARLLGAEAALAFSPQFSVEQSVVRDKRWHRFLHQVDMAREPTVSPEDIGGGRYFALFGGDAGRDRKHAERFLKIPGVRVLRTEGGYHNFPRQLKAQGLLDRLIAAVIDGGDPSAQPEFKLSAYDSPASVPADPAEAEQHG
ncbi:hypothetical protein SAMN05421538_102503 [Paracoccus isoporae]|uniref:Esterase n=1 Tax=Paracoccus isoporae TaxID=591205 RepID=A0A1G6XWE5_9RHOB|nr:hypothetical protein [Paracoccus isoporae]SDD81747.1 hypothetical protein SAMN05421538_102503 [Paracoccus isoporae]